MGQEGPRELLDKHQIVTVDDGVWPAEDFNNEEAISLCEEYDELFEGRKK